MPDLEDMTPGQVLADASVADFIGTLGLAIAAAQKALDDNSVSQMGEFIKPIEALGGKSLLDIGLMPAFYHYQHADVSCSLQLSMRVARDTSVGLNLNGSYNSEGTTSTSGTSASSSTESRTSASTTERTATVSVSSSSTGALTAGGRQFALTGADALTRIRALQQALTADTTAGVPMALYSAPTDTFAITTTAPAERVVATARTATFLDNTFGAGLIRIEQDTATDYVLNGTTTVTTTAQGSVAAYAAHVTQRIDAAGYDAELGEADEPILNVYFGTGRHHVEVFTADGLEENRYARHGLQVLAAFCRDAGQRLTVQGFTDTQPYPGGRAVSDDANTRLGQRRAHEVRDALIGYGAPADLVTVLDSPGAAAARRAGGDADQVRWRVARVKLDPSFHVIRVMTTTASQSLENVAPANLIAPITTGNAWVHLYAPVTGSLTGTTVTVDGTEFPISGAAAEGAASGSPRAHAANLAASVIANTTVDFTASADDNVVTFYRKASPFSLQLFTTESRDMTLSGTEGVTVNSQFTRTSSSTGTNQASSNQTVAFGASLDVRHGRQFDTTVTGNSAITARLVSVPAPPQFLETIREFLTPDQ